MRSGNATHQLSFRDPDGRLLQTEDRVIRFVFEHGRSRLDLFLNSATGARFRDRGALIDARIMRREEVDRCIAPLLMPQLIDEATTIVEHSRIPFPNFPYEWTPGMLGSAAELTLDLAESLLEEGAGLKDATPYNIQFSDSRPVFLDALSFETRDPCDATWLPYAQFIRTFLLPLLVNKEFVIPIRSILTTNRDGLTPEAVYRIAGPLKRLTPGFLGCVTLPSLLGRNEQACANPRPGRRSPAQAKYIVHAILSQLRKSLANAKPRHPRRSTWSSYSAGEKSYTAAARNAKETFVLQALEEFKPKHVLDLGCNDGHFSMLAARLGASVVGVDSDEAVVDRVWQECRKVGLAITPLVVDLTRPSPPLGWKNQECSSFLERATGRFDLVMMLALMHHLMVGDGIPVMEIISLVAELTRDMAIVEYVGPEDQMFKHISRGRDHLYDSFNQGVFEAACARHFEIVRTTAVKEARCLYLLRKK